MAEPPKSLSDPSELFVAYLDWERSVIARKLAGLTEQELRTAVLPSGWTPIELLKHLVYMEQRWLVWGFAAQQVPSPWGDHDLQTERWHVGPQETLAELLAALDEVGQKTRAIIAGAKLEDPAAIGGRFQEDGVAPSLSWILFHVLQEYARHAGHLDVVRELIDGDTGE
ncbi:hypothetical protein Rhe02_64900 [Rhizocola hellebori]|uniref:DinB family protein n=2 Tax=Rhizocola hellebori TaxID=1392758 RepID=A0A8J3QF08_9ACTN|nr:hypothetical protein Rhe02_64900 [Rhizocola hellebori]